MNTMNMSRRLQIVVEYTDDAGKEKSGRLTFGNVSPTATDDQLYRAGESLASLQERNMKHVVKVDTVMLSQN